MYYTMCFCHVYCYPCWQFGFVFICAVAHSYASNPLTFVHPMTAFTCHLSRMPSSALHLYPGPSALPRHLSTSNKPSRFICKPCGPSPHHNVCQTNSCSHEVFTLPPYSARSLRTVRTVQAVQADCPQTLFRLFLAEDQAKHKCPSSNSVLGLS